MAVTYMTAEQIREGIDSGDMNIINGMASGAIAVGIPEEEPQGDSEEVVEGEVPVTTDDPPVQEEEMTVDEKEELKKQLDAIATIRRNEKLKAQKEADRIRIEAEQAKKEAEEFRKKLEEYEKRQKEEKIVPSELNIDDEDDESSELESEYSKKTRKILTELLKKTNLPQADPESISELRKELEALKRTQEENLEFEKKKQLEDKKNRIFSEINELQSKNEYFRTNLNFKDLNSKMTSFKQDVTEFVKATNKDAREGDIERAVYAIVNGTTESEKAFRERAVKEGGIVIPDDASKYYEISSLLDLKSGYSYNNVTGAYEPILDEFGNQVTYRSLEEVIKLRDYDKRIAEAKRDTAKSIQKKLTKIENAPITLSGEEITESDSSDQMTEDRMRFLFTLNAKKIKSDPKLKAEVIKAYESLNMSPPAGLLT